jgi:hypothetical protein
MATTTNGRTPTATAAASERSIEDAIAAGPEQPITAGTEKAVEITRPATQRILVPIVGTSPLIMHRFSEKSRRQMLDAMQGVRTPKRNKDPEAEFEASLYRMADGQSLGFPVLAFKAATVGAARFYGKEVSMTGLRQVMFFTGEVGSDGMQMAPITGDVAMREDIVRVGQGTDLRYRGEVSNWTSTLDIRFVASSLTQGSVLSLIDAGGMGVGVGEWRPAKNGTSGTYQVDADRDVVVLEA